MGVEEPPIERFNVTDQFATDFIEHGGSPAEVGDVERGRVGSRTYYRNGPTYVTSRYIVVNNRRFAIRDLQRAGVLRRSKSSRPGRFLLVTGVVVAITGLVVWLANVTPLIVAIIFVGAASLVVLGIAFLRQPPTLELWAYVQGIPTLLLVSRDSVQFGRLTRALQRAIEAQREHG